MNFPKSIVLEANDTVLKFKTLSINCRLMKILISVLLNDLQIANEPINKIVGVVRRSIETSAFSVADCADQSSQVTWVSTYVGDRLEMLKPLNFCALPGP